MAYQLACASGTGRTLSITPTFTFPTWITRKPYLSAPMQAHRSLALRLAGRFTLRLSGRDMLQMDKSELRHP